jgi:CRP-like cAMP-binding protein
VSSRCSPSYLFARLCVASLESSRQRARHHSIVAFGGCAPPVADSVSSLVHSRIQDDGFVRHAEPLPAARKDHRSANTVFVRRLRTKPVRSELIIILLATVDSTKWIQLRKAATWRSSVLTSNMAIELHVHSLTTRSLAPAQRYPRGVELFRQGRRLEEVLNVSSGVVKLVCVRTDGRESILSLAFPGFWLGAAPVIANCPTPASAITCTEALLSRIPASTFRNALEGDPAFSSEIHRAQSLELCRQAVWLGRVNSLSSRERLQCVLRQLLTVVHSHTTSSGIRLHLPIHHWELATLVGVSPEHLSRLLRGLQRSGVLVRQKGFIVVPDISRLCPDWEFDQDAPSPP